MATHRSLRLPRCRQPRPLLVALAAAFGLWLVAAPSAVAGTTAAAGGIGTQASSVAATASAGPAAMLLAKVLGPAVAVERYLVSEKYDGVRARWDGQVLRFRSGAAVHAPAWFLARLPRQALDGELWLGRGRFDALSAMVRKELPLDQDWRQIRYMVFELPDAPGPYSARAGQISQVVAEAGWEQLVAVEQFRVNDRAELQRRLDDVVRSGGEGLVLHLADAPTQTGRSDVLLKLKPLDDAEAVVLEHLPGKGKYRGQLGALRVRTPEGRIFRIGTGLSDTERASPPPIGTTITYTYRGLTGKGLPRFASFLRVRDGL